MAFAGVRVFTGITHDTAGGSSASDSAPPPDDTSPIPSSATEPSATAPSTTLLASPPAILNYSAVAGDPLGPAAALVIGDYLQAVNDGRYEDAYRVYTRKWQTANPFASWEQAVKTSQHRNAAMTTVEQSADGSVAADVSFQSTQAAGLGPGPRPQETCTQWNLVYRLVPDNNSYYPLSIDGSEPAADSAPCA